MTIQCVSIISRVPIAGEVRANRFVTIGANGTAESAADANSQGVSSESSPAGSQVAFSVAKKDGADVFVEAGGAIAVGDEVSAGAEGVAVSGGANVQGVAVTAASAAGEIITISYGN